MADVTFGVKVREELRDKVNAMIEASGMKSKEWFETMISTIEMQHLKENASDFSKDLSELELHTNRINQIVANFVQRAVFEKDELTKKIDEVKVARDQVIIGYQEEVSGYKNQLKQIQKDIEAAIRAKEEAERQHAQLRETVEHNKALINEYKEKIDTLTGLVNEYKEAASENKTLTEQNREMAQQNKEQTVLIEQLRVKFEECQTASEAQVIEFNAKFEELKGSLEEARREAISQLQEKHKMELERIEERKEVEKERALIAQRTELQDKQQALIETHAKRIEELYEENRQLRIEINKK